MLRIFPPFTRFSKLKYNKGFNLLLKCFYSKRSTTSDERLHYFDKAADNWWDPQNGSMKQLHIIQAPRMSFICGQLKNKCAISGPQMMSGLEIVDVGCGVGLLSESLAKLGANVTGLDPSENSIEIAKKHAETINSISGNLEYLHCTAEEHANLRGEFYDVALAFFVLEHVPNREQFIKSCLSLIKPKGSLIIMHTNRNISFYFHLKWHMYVTGICQKNIMKHRQALKKDEVVKMVCQENCELVGKSGAGFPWVGRNAYLTPSESHFSILHFIKRG